MPINKTRAERARAALADYLEENYDIQTAVTDLLADAMHLAKIDDEELDTLKACISADMHYHSEV